MELHLTYFKLNFNKYINITLKINKMPEEQENPKPEKKSLFAQKEQPGQKLLGDISNQVNNISRSLKTLEDRYTTLRKRSQVLEQNMITNEKKVLEDINTINSDIMEMKHQLADFKEKLEMLGNEIKLGATKEEVTALQKYISYWEPLNFITRAEVDKIIDEKLNKP